MPKVSGYNSLYDINQLLYKNTIEVLGIYISQTNKPATQVTLLEFQQRVGSNVQQINDVTVTEQNNNITVVESKRQRACFSAEQYYLGEDTD